MFCYSNRKVIYEFFICFGEWQVFLSATISPRVANICFPTFMILVYVGKNYSIIRWGGCQLPYFIEILRYIRLRSCWLSQESMCLANIRIWVWGLELTLIIIVIVIKTGVVVVHLVFPRLGKLEFWVPRIPWPANLACLRSSWPVRDPISKKKGEGDPIVSSPT